MGFYERNEKYEKKDSAEVTTFLSYMEKQLKALKNDKLPPRSSVKAEGNGYVVKLGKVQRTYTLDSKEATMAFLEDVIASAKTDQDLIADVEKAYAGAAKRGGKSKPAG